MTHKTQRIAESVRHLQGRGTDPRYLGFFELFNRQQFYEAHDVLEDLWLEDRQGPHGDFYKALIQLAGAFVHVQKGNTGPAQALLRLASKNFSKYPSVTFGLQLGDVLALIQRWLNALSSGADFRRADWPKIEPQAAAGTGVI